MKCLKLRTAFVSTTLEGEKLKILKWINCGGKTVQHCLKKLISVEGASGLRSAFKVIPTDHPKRCEEDSILGRISQWKPPKLRI